MAKGGFRVGAGRKPKPLGVHLMQGTYRSDRHGPLPAPPMETAAKPVPDDRGPGSAGTRIRRDSVARVSALQGRPECALLRQAARILDDCEMAVTPRARQLSVRLFAALVAQLRLSPALAAAPTPVPSKWADELK
jgi:hypothetical protein